MTSIKEYESYLAFAKKSISEAGAILEKFRTTFTIEKTKDDLHLDIATSADYAAEKCIISAINKTFPSHGVLAEESGVSLPSADYVWIIDPLDGTKEYTRNSPYYYTLLSLEYMGKPVCAVAYQPAIKRMFTGVLPSKAMVNERNIHVSPQSHFEQSFIQVGLPNKTFLSDEVDRYLDAVKDLVYSSYRLRNTQWDVEGLLHVAMGAAEAYILPPSANQKGKPKWWDVSSGLQIVEMAGGKITDFYGKPHTPHNTVGGIVASNGLIHTDLLDLLKKYYPPSIS